MSNDYEILLTATIEHLRALQAHGVQFVPLENGTLPPFSPTAQQRPPTTSKTIDSGAPRSALAPVLTSAVPSRSVNAPLREAETFTSEPLPPAQRETAWAALRSRAMSCQQCPHLASSRRNVVFGSGSVQAELMFVGEAPGADEDAQGEPFVGAAGQLLTRIIQAMGTSREAVYIANILKCRPDTPGQLSGNRKPLPDEMKTCLPYLLAQINLIRPKVIVALGGTAMEGLLGHPVSIMKLRSRWQQFRGIPVMPTYHPAYLLRNQSLIEKRKVWEDMLQVMSKLNLPISDKQRGYFLQKPASD